MIVDTVRPRSSCSSTSGPTSLPAAQRVFIFPSPVFSLAITFNRLCGARPSFWPEGSEAEERKARRDRAEGR